VTSQALRDPESVAPPQETTPAEIVKVARRQGAEIVVSTYNEPLITTEWGVAVCLTGRTGIPELKNKRKTAMRG